MRAVPTGAGTVAERCKRNLRRAALERRVKAAADAGTDAALRARDNFLAAVPVPADAVVSGYAAVREELDPGPLLEHLHGAAHRCALPVVAGRGRPLVFREWWPGAPMSTGVLGIARPLPEAPELVPEVLLVPLLAYDADGYRLGYGGGYYDMTLAALRRTRPILAVGFGYAGQAVDRLPREPHDQRLDWIVTETEARPVSRREGGSG